MPITYRRPGVYLEESLLVNSADTASTFTIGVFIGAAAKGPVLEPTRVDSWSDYVSVYGGFNPIQLPVITDPYDVTSSRITAPIPANLTALKAHVTYGDGKYAGAAFTTGQYVKLGDNSLATVTGTGVSSVWSAGITGGGVPVPPSGKVQTYLPYTVYAFFQSGGRSAWIIRAISTTVGKEGKAAAIDVNGGDASESPRAAFTLTALSVGSWGNTIKYNLAQQGASVGTAPNANDVFALQILLTNANGVDEVVETFSGLSVKGEIPGSRRIDAVVNDPAAGSQYVRVSNVNEIQGQPVATGATAVPLIGGVDPGIPDASNLVAAADQVTKIEGPAMVNIVGYHNDIALINTDKTAAAYVSTTVSSSVWPDRTDLFVINDSAPPRLPNQPSSGYKSTILSSLGANPGDSYSASYGPWILVPHPTRLGEIVAIPPGGAVMGVAARIDATVGVFRAPAGVIAGITNAVGVQSKFTDTELGDLNSSNINVIRSIPGSGICIMGARTRKTYGADRYVSARRTLIFIKEVLRRTTQFAIFENNDQRLWSSLTMAADRILRPLWEAGGLKGANTGEAYYIRCDDTLNTGSVIASGEVRMEIGVALQYPAEFVIIRITQYDRGTFSAEVVPAT
jgi:hypothetical protein